MEVRPQLQWFDAPGKLNLFLGVVNSGAEIFPPYLAHLVRYFGPPETSALLAEQAVYRPAGTFLEYAGVAR